MKKSSRQEREGKKEKVKGKRDKRRGNNSYLLLLLFTLQVAEIRQQVAASKEQGPESRHLVACSLLLAVRQGKREKV